MESIQYRAAGKTPAGNAALSSMERHIDDLPLLPQVLVRILQLRPDANDYFEQFENLAKEDPGFAVRVIALANSAASSPVVPICTIRDALSRMGVRTVNGLVASLAVQRVFMPTDPTQVQLWKHAIETAVASQQIARMTPALGLDPGEAYLTGLLHDVGRFVMLEHAAPELQKVDEMHWNSPEELIQADIAVYEYTHSELGYLACLHWGLPDTIARLVQAHHDNVTDEILPGSLAASLFCMQVADRLSIFLLQVPDVGDLPDDDMCELIQAKCLRTERERAVLPVEKLSAAIPRIADESDRLMCNLGFG